MIRPGPTSIEPGTAPDGLVLHCYAVPAERLLFVQHLFCNMDLEELDRLAEQGADLAGRDGTANVCLVAFDGDSGARIPLHDWYGVSL